MAAAGNELFVSDVGGRLIHAYSFGGGIGAHEIRVRDITFPFHSPANVVHVGRRLYVLDLTLEHEGPGHRILVLTLEGQLIQEFPIPTDAIPPDARIRSLLRWCDKLLCEVTGPAWTGRKHVAFAFI